MKIPPHFLRNSALLVGLAITVAVTASAGVNSGGGLGRVGSLFSFGSIGSPFATGSRAIGSNTNRTGIVEVLVPWHINTTVQDTDSDGMSDAWEIANGLNPNTPNASADADHDGFTDYQEFVTGTLPLQSGSMYRAYGTVEAGGFRIQCATLAGRKYLIERSLNLSQWTPHEEVIGDGNPLSRLINVPNGQTLGFYHVIVTMYRP